MKPKRFQLIFDIENYPHKKINKSVLRRILTQLSHLIDMQIIKGPIIVEGIKENPGFSGFVIIDYSHISIHTFSAYDEMLIDVFSCKSYSKKVVFKYLTETLGIDKINIKVKTVSWE